MPGADLVGETMVERFVYDTSLGIRATTASTDNVYGGTHYGVSDPLLSATVTIGGFTLTIVRTIVARGTLRGRAATALAAAPQR